MNKIIKNILNRLKCPICKSQIDISAIYSQYYECLSNKFHYTLHIPIEFHQVDSWEIVRFEFDNQLHTIINYFNIENIDEIKSCSINIYSELSTNSIVLDHKMFDLNNFTIEKAAARIKTIFVFQ